MNMKRLICLGILISSVTACAGHRDSQHEKWEDYKKFNPYLENGKETQNQQWSKEDWYVQDWTAQKNPQVLVDGFFKSDVLRKQDVVKGHAVLVVGPNFYRMGGFDKRRVITTVDSVYGITNGGGTIILKDWKTEREIGLFTKEGLQIE